MEKEFITQNSKETQKLGEMLAKEIRDGQIICLSGELGAGKTTFTQGFLKGLGVKGPYTSPTFVIMKEYKSHPTLSLKRRGGDGKIFHIDAYRIGADDMLGLGWEEMTSNSQNIVIIEWAERIAKIIPAGSSQLKFKWLSENRREIKIKTN